MILSRIVGTQPRSVFVLGVEKARLEDFIVVLPLGTFGEKENLRVVIGGVVIRTGTRISGFVSKIGESLLECLVIRGLPHLHAEESGTGQRCSSFVVIRIVFEGPFKILDFRKVSLDGLIESCLHSCKFPPRIMSSLERLDVPP